MKYLFLFVALASCAVLVACGGDVSAPTDDAAILVPTDAPSDAPADAPVRPPLDGSFTGAPPPSPDGAGWCCEPATPTCDCAPLGGFVLDPGACARDFGVCDVAPVDWILGTDEHGCVRYTTRFPTVCECLCIPDLGV